MRLLITRPPDDAIDTANALRRRGHDIFLSPLFDVQPVKDHEILNKKLSAVVFTSRNSVRAFCDAHPIRGLKAFCVGDRTAQLASENGFADVHSANGNARDLVALIQNSWKADNFMILRVASDMTPDILDRTLSENGFHLERRILYTTPPITTFNPDTIQLLKEESLNGILFFSPRTATLFCDLLVKAGLTEACRNITAFCISDDTVRALHDIHFHRISASIKPTQQSLLESIA